MVLNWFAPFLDWLLVERFEMKGTMQIIRKRNAVLVWLSKPLYKCVVCMASLWTVLFWVLLDKPLTIHLLFAVLICAGINKILCAFLEKSTEYGC